MINGILDATCSRWQKINQFKSKFVAMEVCQSIIFSLHLF